MEDAEKEQQDSLNLSCQYNQTSIPSEKCLDNHYFQAENLQESLIDMNSIGSHCLGVSTEKEMEKLWKRVRTTEMLLSYLKSKAKIIAAPHFANFPCGDKHLTKIKLHDDNVLSLAECSEERDIPHADSSDEAILPTKHENLGKLVANDGTYVGDIFTSVQMVTDVMEFLVKRAMVAESEAAAEKVKVNLSQEEIKKKTLKIANMSAKVEEIESFALRTSKILGEMKQQFQDMVQETSIQRQRHAENEQELVRVKHDFESLKSYVSSLISVRETLVSSEKQFQTMEKLFERLVTKTTNLEAEKAQKEVEIQKLMEENIRLHSQLDKKEAQLLAMNEQCKFMALNSSSG